MSQTAFIIGSFNWGFSVFGCLAFPFLLIGPFVLIFLQAWSVLDAEPLSGFSLAVNLIGAAFLIYLVPPWALPEVLREERGFWVIWSIAATIGVIGATPIAESSEMRDVLDLAA